MADSISIRMVKTSQRGKKRNLQKRGNQKQNKHPKKNNGCVKIAETPFLTPWYTKKFLRTKDVLFVEVNESLKMKNLQLIFTNKH